ncbi:hypothetical protein [Enterococcus alishanensis]|uniref:Uncharacterized protein n=1 Tax=Enterococcus alishanensis TaxID=1303817 RepID=A0ABS6TCT0_9ENTE|nr:hypothetical protein [Enterococcus alishanensis]MBV7390708.1 hypothetical protein [Enterococcus alishanensis]
MKLFINNNSSKIISEKELHNKLKTDALKMWRDQRNQYPTSFKSFDEFHNDFFGRTIKYYRQLHSSANQSLN